MKRIVLILILLGLGAPFTYSQDSMVSIPDTAFLHALIDEGVDANGDSLISFKEAEAIHFLELHGREISEMSGIEAFVNLDTLWCGGNKLTNLDVSSNLALKSLVCGGYWFVKPVPLSSLNVTGCTALEYLACNSSYLSSLDLCNNESLKYINISYVPSLDTVYVWESPFPTTNIELDKTGSPNVVYIDCTATSLMEYNNDECYFYPNPANDLLTIETSRPGQHFIEITSLNGQLLYTDRMGGLTHQIDLSSFEKGLYFITVRSRDYVRTEKIIQQ